MVKTSDFESENSGSSPGGVAKPQTDREIAEMIAQFRTPPGFSWADLANDIETVLKGRIRKEDIDLYELASDAGYDLCSGYCHEFCGGD